MVSVVVTGATGFVGGAIARQLVARGDDVTGLGRNLHKGAQLVQDGVRFLPVDVTDTPALAQAVRGSQFVVHAAAESAGWGARKLFHDANVLGTRNVLAAAKAAGVERTVFMSSPSVYVDATHRFAILEGDPLPERSLGPLAWSKRLAEDEVRASGVPVVTLRPQTIIGPGDLSLFPPLLRAAKSGIIPVIGNGGAICDVTYIDNVVDAVVAVLGASKQVDGKTYNLTNNAPVAFYALLEGVLRDLGRRFKKRHVPFGAAWAWALALENSHRMFAPMRAPRLTRYTVCVLGRSRTLDVRAARADFGYVPRVGVSDGIERFVRWWCSSARERGDDH